MDQQMPSAPAPEQEQPQGEMPAPSEKGVTGLITGIHTSMLKLKEVLDSVPSIPDPLKAQLGSLIQGYKEFIGGLSKAVQGGAEQAPAPEAAPMGEPQAAGPKPQPRGPMPMSGGSNVRPAL